MAKSKKFKTTEEMYCIVTDYGHAMFHSLGDTRKECIDAWVKRTKRSWERNRRIMGYSCHKVNIVIVPAK